MSLVTSLGEHPLQSGQFVTFHVDSLFFGVPVGSVQEILRHQPMTIVPLAPTSISGLVNLRGQIIAAVNMREVLHLPSHPQEEHSMMIVLHTGGETVAMLVDRIGDVLTLSDDSYEPTPTIIPPAIVRSVSGIHKLADRLLLILNTQNCLSHDSTTREETTRSTF